MSFLSASQKSFIASMSDESDFGDKVPIVSGRTSILNDNLRLAIENLSTTESDSDDFTVAGAIHQSRRLVDNKFYQPYKTTSEFAEDIQFRHVVAYFINFVPYELRESIENMVTKWQNLYKAVIMKLRKRGDLLCVMEIVNFVMKIVASIIHGLYLLSFTWQLLITGIQTGILYSDNFWGWLLDDRTSYIESSHTTVVNKPSSEEKLSFRSVSKASSKVSSKSSAFKWNVDSAPSLSRRSTTPEFKFLEQKISSSSSSSWDVFLVICLVF